jgi:carbon-monoxide dehydrogenase medium subunit
MKRSHYWQSDLDGAKILAGGPQFDSGDETASGPTAVARRHRADQIAAYIREEGDQILIGATTTHYQLESSDLLKQICPFLPECAKSIGDVQVRNKGTIGGSIAHSDPAGDWPAAVLALDADLVLVGPNGERTVKAENFFVDLLTTDLQPGEILREFASRSQAGRFGQAYQKVPHPASGFAVVGVAVI